MDQPTTTAEELWEVYRHKPFHELPRLLQRAIKATMRRLWRIRHVLEQPDAQDPQ